MVTLTNTLIHIQSGEKTSLNMNMQNNELISVIMASNRIDSFLIESINSILKQSYTNIELIFIANGNESGSISKYIKENINDSRLFVYETPIAQFSFSLNLAISNANGKYIARMDADDISVPNRLMLQYNYLVKNNLDMVGSNLILINSDNVEIGNLYYPNNAKINKNLYFRNTFAHNTILIKKDIIINARGYNSGFNSEDYDLWLRLKRENIKWNNMSESLVYYRIHDASTQRKRLGYAESAGYSLRELLLDFSITKLIAVPLHIMKTLIKSK
ncbi:MULTISPECIES: glycosyltransferase [Providencia]|uniref:glycosyltransferase n=1 Tax=Providencia TaxID=586 RepID=UPI001D0CF0F1|nr:MULTISPECIES: glycosyltransferase [Providencia]MCB6146321.1 glycosyltransferase [Providencia rettgeri]UDQ67279.1 glycosyltransferase [Providencia rettgeri]